MTETTTNSDEPRDEATEQEAAAAQADAEERDAQNAETNAGVEERDGDQNTDEVERNLNS